MDFIDTMNTSEQEILRKLQAKLFYGCNIPFAVANSIHFYNFVKRLRVAFIPANRQQLAGTLLNKTYEELTERIYAGNESKDAVLLIDGWKNSIANTKNIVCMIHNSSGERIFLDSWDITTESETGENLIKVVEEAVVKAKEILGFDVYAVVSDNASTMMKMGRNIYLFHTTCDSHSANLLAKALVDKQLVVDVTSVLKEFKRSALEQELVNRNGSRIVLPCEVRFCTYRDTFKCYLRNLQIMRQIFVDGQHEIKSSILDILCSKDIESLVQDALVLFEPVCVLIDKCQSPKFNIADAVEEWCNLEIPSDNATYNELLGARLTKVLTDIKLTANFLHPKYQGRSFVTHSELIDLVEDFLLDNLDAEGLSDLHAYKTKEGIFAKLFKKGLTDHKAFWSYAARKHPQLAKLATKLLKIPASTAQIERLFSQWSYVHSSTRNRLGVETSKKLISIYYTLKAEDENKSDEY